MVRVSMVDMNIEDFAHGVLMEAMPAIPVAVLEVIRDDIAAGEFFTSLLELIERAPQVVSAAAVDAVGQYLDEVPEGPHRDVGLRAVARYRSLERA